MRVIASGLIVGYSQSQVYIFEEGADGFRVFEGLRVTASAEMIMTALAAIRTLLLLTTQSLFNRRNPVKAFFSLFILAQGKENRCQLLIGLDDVLPVAVAFKG